MIQQREKSLYAHYQFAIQFASDIARLLGFPLAHDDVYDERFSAIIEGEKKGDFHATTAGGLNTLYVYTDIIKEQFAS